MLKSECETIGGLQLTCTQFSPLPHGYVLGIKVANMLAPLLSMLGGASGASTVNALLTTDVMTLGPIVGALLGQLAKPEHAKLPVELLAGTVADVPDESGELTRISLTDQAAINATFGGKLPAMLQAMWFAIRVNYLDFMPGALGISRPKTPVAKASGS